MLKKTRRLFTLGVCLFFFWHQSTSCPIPGSWKFHIQRQFVPEINTTKKPSCFLVLDMSNAIFNHSTDYFPLESDVLITTQFLSPAKIECQSDQALNSFKLEQRNGKEFRYVYQCKQLEPQVAIRYTMTTTTVVHWNSCKSLIFS